MKKHRLLKSLKYLLPYWHIEILAVIIATIVSLLVLISPWINKMIIDDVIVNKNYHMLVIVCEIIVAAGILIPVTAAIREWLFAKIGESAIIDIRNDLIKYLHSQSIDYFQKEKTGKLMSLFTNDVPTLGSLFTSTISDFTADTLSFLATIIYMFTIDWKLTLITITILPPYVLIIFLFSKRVRTASKNVQEGNADISARLQESISGIREIKAYAQETVINKKHFSVFNILKNMRLKQTILQTSLSGGAQMTIMIGMAMVIWFGGQKAVHGDMKVGVLIAYIGYTSFLFGPISRYMQLNNRVQSSLGAADRIFDCLETIPELKDNIHGRELPNLEGRIRFEELYFAYTANNYVLNNLNFEIKAGETIAVVGASGSGKTTIANLILRFYDPTKGKITIDDIDLRDISVSSLRQHMSVVFQDNFLFAASIRENIVFGKNDATDEEVVSAAKAAHAHEFIIKLPNGYNTELGERGVNISGGQKQRLSIARAILRNPKILILDEATSALDAESEKLIQDALNNLMQGRTSFVIAHRLSTIIHASRILVLDKGHIVEVGTHNELMQKNGYYKNLFNMQFNKMQEKTMS